MATDKPGALPETVTTPTPAPRPNLETSVPAAPVKPPTPWRQLVPDARTRWPRLTEPELAAFDNDRDALAKKIAEHYGRPLEEMKAEVRDFYVAHGEPPTWEPKPTTKP